MNYKTLRGAKYELLAQVREAVPVRIVTRYTHREVESPAPYIRGQYLFVPAGYRWDGASGPAVDTPGTMLPSLIHDACYGMIRDGRLDYRARAAVDVWFRLLLRRERVGFFRRWGFYLALRLFGGFAAGPMR